MATTGDLFEEMMATYHSFGIAGKVVGKFHWDDLSSVYMTVGDADTSSVLQYRHFRVPAFDQRGTFVESDAAALRKLNTMPRLIE